MSPFTHLLASWIVAVHTIDNPRDARLVTLAGVLPDIDGLGLGLDLLKDPSLRGGAYYYQEYHHWLAHGIAGGLVIAILMTCFARCRWKVFGMALVAFHLHLICDLLGSRGPSPQDFWTIFYLGPFSRHWELVWSHQWQLDGWQNRIIGCTLFLWALWLAVKHGHSFVGVFNRRLDSVVVGTLRKWFPPRLA